MTIAEGDPCVILFAADGKPVAVPVTAARASDDKCILARCIDGKHVPVIVDAITAADERGIMALCADGKNVPVKFDVAEGDMMLCGNFLHVNAIAFWGIMSYDTATGIANNYPFAGALNAIDNDPTIVTGNFSFLGGVSCRGFFEHDSKLYGYGIGKYFHDKECFGFMVYDSVNDTWGPVTNAPSWTDANNTIYAGASYDGDIYLAMTHPTGGTGVYKFDGTTWTNTNLTGASIADVSGMIVYDGKLIVWGNYGGTYARLAAWDGSSWAVLGSPDVFIRDCCVCNDLLVVCGYALSSIGGGSVKGVASFDGTNWDDMSGGIEYSGGAGRITKAKSLNGRAIFGGTFDKAGTPATTVNGSIIAYSFTDSEYQEITSSGAGTISGIGVIGERLWVYRGEWNPIDDVYSIGNWLWYNDDQWQSASIYGYPVVGSQANAYKFGNKVFFSNGGDTYVLRYWGKNLQRSLCGATHYNRISGAWTPTPRKRGTVSDSDYFDCYAVTKLGDNEYFNFAQGRASDLVSRKNYGLWKLNSDSSEGFDFVADINANLGTAVLGYGFMMPDFADENKIICHGYFYDDGAIKTKIVDVETGAISEWIGLDTYSPSIQLKNIIDRLDEYVLSPVGGLTTRRHYYNGASWGYIQRSGDVVFAGYMVEEYGEKLITSCSGDGKHLTIISGPLSSPSYQDIALTLPDDYYIPTGGVPRQIKWLGGNKVLLHYVDVRNDTFDTITRGGMFLIWDGEAYGTNVEIIGQSSIYLPLSGSGNKYELTRGIIDSYANFQGNEYAHVLGIAGTTGKNIAVSGLDNKEFGLQPNGNNHFLIDSNGVFSQPGNGPTGAIVNGYLIK